MLDEKVKEFLDNKKQDFLKKKIKQDTNDEDKLLFTQQASEKYSLSSWLINASFRAKQLFITTHPAKFVHPSAKTTNIIASCPQGNDGLLRTGNVKVKLDIYGNAAALDVEKFLRIQLDDKTILEHLELNTKLIKSMFDISGINFNEIRDNFLEIKNSDIKQTSGRLRQVYFPVNGDYHLLTPLVPSGIIFKLKEKINNIRFSDENEKVREAIKKQTPINGVIENILNLTAIVYGGTKSQNISTLNSQNGGVSFLLSSMPPRLEVRKTQAPKNSFFRDCLWANLFKSDFEEYHKILNLKIGNNKRIRDNRDHIVINSIFKVKRLAQNIRGIKIGWSDGDNYSSLDKWQKIWLDDKYQDIRDDNKQNEDYLKKAYSSFANWFIGNYDKSVEDSKTLGSDDIERIKKVLDQESELLI